MEKLNTTYSTSGIYNDTEVQMTPSDFIHLEHTDGLNYASIEMERYDDLWQSVKHDKLGISLMSGAGAGAIIPRTDAHLFGSGSNHYWNLSGWGASIKIGLKFNFARHFYLASDFKYGYLQLINIHTSQHLETDKAKQHIVFYENSWILGFRF